MATDLVAKMGQNYLPPALFALSIRNGMGYRNLKMRVNSANDASISCKKFVNCGLVTPEKTELICILFLGQGKKLAYLVKYLRIYWTDFYKLHHMKARFWFATTC